MTDLKENFRKWLSKKHKDSTVNTYIRRIIAVYKKNFVQENFHFSNNYLGILTENLIPLLVKSYEFSNKEYYIDRVTIWHALDYFSRIFEAINTSKHLNNNQTVKLYFYCYEGDFQIDSVSFENLRDYVQLFNSFCYKRDKQSIHLSSEEIRNFLRKIKKIIAENNIKDSSVYDSALHIIYPYRSARLEKTALTHYCSFLYNQTGLAQYDYQNNLMVTYILIENPNSKIGGNYKIDQNLTGETPLQIKLKDDERVYNHDNKEKPSFVLIIADLVHIFNLDKKTVSKYFLGNNTINQTEGSEISNIDRKNTVLRTYFCIDSTNSYLERHYHSIHKKINTPTNNDKNLDAYKDWVNRQDATDFLEISHNCFHTLVKPNNCSYLNYIDDPRYPAEDKKQYKYRKYYKPDLEYLKNTRLFRDAQNKKIKYQSKQQN